MMSATLRLVVLMPCMVATTWSTSVPPRPASSDASSASFEAWVALSLLCWTALLSSLVVPAVYCAAADWRSVRSERS